MEYYLDLSQGIPGGSFSEYYTMLSDSAEQYLVLIDNQMFSTLSGELIQKAYTAENIENLGIYANGPID